MRKATLPALLPDWHPGVWGSRPIGQAGVPCAGMCLVTATAHLTAALIPQLPVTTQTIGAGDRGLLGCTDWLGSWFGGIKPALFSAHTVRSPLPEGHSCPGLTQEDGDAGRTQVDVSSPSRWPVGGQVYHPTPSMSHRLQRRVESFSGGQDNLAGEISRIVHISIGISCMNIQP